jgi:predicted nuclease of restriction endonuclease-like (RecB) superfamily
MLEKAVIAEAGDTIAPEEAIKDPFVLEFLGLRDEYSETQLEEGLIQHLTDFLLELGDDFGFSQDRGGFVLTTPGFVSIYSFSIADFVAWSS